MIRHTNRSDSSRATRRGFLSLTAAIGGMVVSTGAVTAQSTAAEVDVCFPNQATDGSVVRIESATLPDGGFLAIHDAQSLLAGNTVESVIGVSEYLDSGTHKDITVEVYRNVPGASFDQTELSDPQLVVAMPHQDENSSEVYEFVQSGGDLDGPYLTDGQPVLNPARIWVDES